MRRTLKNDIVAVWKKPRLRGLMLALLAMCGMVDLAAGKSTTNSPPRLNVKEAPLSREVKAATSLAPIIKNVAPSVVNIYSTMIVRERQTSNPLADDPFFRRFFGERFGEQSQPRERKEQSLGSGIIVTADGYILTANHVLD